MLETRVRTSELIHAEPRGWALGKARAWGSCRCMRRSFGVRGFMMKTLTRRVRWEKAEEEWTSASGLISVNPSCQKSRVAAYMDTINRVVSQSTSRTTSKALVRGNHQNMTFFVFNQIFPFFFREKVESVWTGSMCSQGCT